MKMFKAFNKFKKKLIIFREQNIQMQMKTNKKKWFGIVLIVLLTIISYAPIFEADFIEFDDRLYVTKNDWVRAGITWEGTIWAFSKFHSANWHPLTWLSHMMDCEIYGMNAVGHHISNLILHIMNSILLFMLFSQVTGFFNRSLVLALLFALHPLHVESVAWIAERKDMLSTFFGLLCILSYYQYTQTFQKKHYYLCFSFLGLSLMSKPMLVTMPFLLVILDFWPIHRKDDFRFRDKYLFFVPVVGVSLITFLAQYLDKAVNPLSSLALIARLLNALNAIGGYLIKTVWPTNFSVLYPHPGNSVHTWPAVFWFVVLIILILFGVYRVKHMPYILTGLMWFLISLLPVIGIVQVGAQAMADRYMYIPHIGLFWAIIWFFADFSKKKTWQYIIKTALIIFLIIFASKTYFQAKVWKNPETLFLQAIENTKNNYLIYNNLGVLAYEKKSHEQALTYFDHGLAIRPHFSECRLNKAKCLIMMKRFDQAKKAYETVISYDEKNTEAYLGLAEINRRQKKYHQALKQCEKALEFSIQPEKTYLKIANVFEQSGDYQSSAYYYKKLLEITPLSPINHYEYARILIKMNQHEKAISHLIRSISLKPSFASAYNNLGALYAEINQLDKAYAYISMAFKLAPDSENVIKNYKIINEKMRVAD